jgi:putative serine protease PepD
MSEQETNPQRPQAFADAEPPYPTAELPRVDRGQSDAAAPPASPAGPDNGPDTVPVEPVTGVASTPAEQPTAVQSAIPAEQPTLVHPASPGPTGPPALAAPSPPYGQPVPSAALAGPYPQNSGQQPGYPPALQHPSSWLGAEGYPGQPAPGGQGYPGQPAAGGPVPPHVPNLGGGPPPGWTPGHSPATPASGPGRAVKGLVVGAAALVLMLGSGLAGGVVALAVNGGSSGGTRTYTAAPILNSADLPKIAAAVQNSVVSISTGNTEGSGVVLTADGYVLTNNHVVASASGGTVKVTFADGKNANAKIMGTDPKTDLAVVKADGVSGLTPAKFGDSDAMQVGDTVLALGSPLGLQGSVTAGIISARDRTIQTGADNQQPGNPLQQQQQQSPVSSISGLLQTDAPINPGNSGGALVNTNGEVIGINTAIATSGQSNGNIGVGFAIPSSKAKAVAQALQGGQKVSHPSLGVGVGDAPNGGALISSVTPGSPAANAGLQAGDIIRQFGGKAINAANDLVGAVQGGKVGDRVQLTFSRNGAEKTATVTLAETS